MIDKLYTDPELVQFYDLENGWGTDTEFCFQLASTAQSILDLGCGTGILAARLGKARRVVGVDPASAMLDQSNASRSACFAAEPTLRISSRANQPRKVRKSPENS